VIAGALVLGPEIVVADEPVSMLDVSIRTEILKLLLDLRTAHGLTYLFITHDLSVAWVIADRIAVMYLGRILEIGAAEDVIRRPGNPYTQALVSVMPNPEPPEIGQRAKRQILAGETPSGAGILERCRTSEPPLFDMGNGHAAACWLAEGGLPLPVLEVAPTG
jgi:ABC-type oligopeptide transport system ATPase subunit